MGQEEAVAARMDAVLPFDQVQVMAATLGLTALACLPPPPRLDATGIDRMIADGLGDLEWIARHRELRLEPSSLLPTARSLIVCAFHYDPAAPPSPDGLRLARYAAGKDYHGILRPRLGRLARALDVAIGRAPDDPQEHRAAVDSAPVNERTLALLAGLGWIGRNALLIRPDAGSWCVLGVLLTPVAIEERRGPHGADRCGSCTRCETICPTNALVDRRVISTRCISYLTIEHKGVIPRELARVFQGWWFGCDLCQEVCPWNRFAPPADDPRLTHQADPTSLFAVTADKYDQRFAASAVRRIPFERFRRNLLVAAWSIKRDDLVALADGPEELVLRQRQELGL